MAAIVLTLAEPPTAHGAAHVDIFPGSATPAVFPASSPFWIGYGFTVEAEGGSGSASELPPDTRFELLVDGEPVPLVTDTRIAKGRTVSKRSIATFAGGLAPGWHRFEGRWYDAGTLALSSDRRIEFVEP
ncbi:MAG TPA: hypothetical protein VI503_07935 [Gaiellaceae bacterium]|nr:hypothetical protein [Gaiellaceae bacterium]